MTLPDYLLNITLVGLVILQVRGHKITRSRLLFPLVATVVVGSQYLHGIPTAGNDLVLVVGLAVLGGLLGSFAALATSVRLDGAVAFAKAGALAAVLWVLGIGPGGLLLLGNPRWEVRDRPLQHRQPHHLGHGLVDGLHPHGTRGGDIPDRSALPEDPSHRCRHPSRRVHPEPRGRLSGCLNTKSRLSLSSGIIAAWGRPPSSGRCSGRAGKG